MIEFWLADENIIFAASGCLLFALIILQIIGVGDFGSDVDLDADTDIDMEISGPSFVDGLLSVLGLKRLPFMIWLGLFLMLFTISGYLGQQILAATHSCNYSIIPIFCHGDTIRASHPKR